MGKVLIVYFSFHHLNTKKITEAMGEELEAQVLKVGDTKKENILNYDLIGFGSGIYFWKHHKNLLEFVRSLRVDGSKKAFVFSTSGVPFGGIFHRLLKKELIKKGFEIVGEFNCLGWDTVGPLKFIGGINKGRPNEKDIKRAKEFARMIKERNNQSKFRGSRKGLI